ncbi:MAG: bifunctional DNA primase/polymerase [Planctomycetota bacterium]|nr:bifunctional DNA primase/polymerase [Planctomycetota bacterium]
MNPLLAAALDYAGRGWCVIPVNGKLPIVKWKQYQTRRATEAELRAFLWHRATGLAVVLGPVSGNLACRDFDEAGAYEVWAKAHPDLARTLPTVKTARGFHVYFRAAGVKLKDLGDGEQRGAGGYVLLPPSLHPSGVRYTWLVPLPAGEVPTVNVAAAGLGEVLHQSEEVLHQSTPDTPTTPDTPSTPTRRHADTQDTHEVSSPTAFTAKIETAVEAVLPYRQHQNHSQLFTLARALKGLEKKRGVPLTASDFQKAMVLYYGHAKERGFLRPGFTKEDYLQELLDGYQKAKYGLGECNLLAEAWEKAKTAIPPARAAGHSPDFRRLVCFVRELQRQTGQAPFFLSVRQLQAIAGLESAMQANRRIRWLVREGYLREVTKGNAKERLASTFRYMGE